MATRRKGRDGKYEKRPLLLGLRRLFRKSSKSVTREAVKDVLETQEKLIENINVLSNDFTNMVEGLSSNNTKLDRQQSNMESIVSDITDKKEIIRDLKAQLSGCKKQEDGLAKEVKEMTAKHQEIALQACRLDLERQQLLKETQESSRREEKLQESYRRLTDRLEETKQQVEAEKHCSSGLKREIFELNIKLKSAESENEKLQEMNKEKESEMYDMKEDRLSLLDYFRQKSLIYEDKLRYAWTQMKEARQELSAVKPLAIEEQIKVDHFVTKLLELDNKLYRRNKLLELLTERLRVHEADFDILSDPDFMPYLDDDMIFENNDLVTESSSTTTEKIDVGYGTKTNRIETL